jgi:hypothetical protein
LGTETWHEERKRLVDLLHAVERGDVTHIDQDGMRQLQAANPENVRLLEQRLAKLNARLGEE